MDPLETLEWCQANGATVHFRRRSRLHREVLIQLPDDITATAPTLAEAIAAIQRKRRGRHAPAIPAHDPLVPYPLHPGFLRDDSVPHIALTAERRAGPFARFIESMRALAETL